jgi:peptidoglycan/LPS O-acetylase OafA/YrhL
MAGMRALVIGAISGMVLVVLILFAAFVWVALFPEGGDSWDAKYFFTHSAFYVLFGTGFALGFGIQKWRERRRSNLIALAKYVLPEK